MVNGQVISNPSKQKRRKVVSSALSSVLDVCSLTWQWTCTLRTNHLASVVMGSDVGRLHFFEWPTRWKRLEITDLESYYDYARHPAGLSLVLTYGACGGQSLDSNDQQPAHAILHSIHFYYLKKISLKIKFSWLTNPSFVMDATQEEPILC